MRRAVAVIFVFLLFASGFAQPPAISELVIHLDEENVVLTWPHSPGAISYNIYRSETPEISLNEDSIATVTGMISGTPPANPLPGEEWIAYIGEDQLPLTMIYIEPGDFMQGAYFGELHSQSDEYPQHLVSLNYGFWIGKFEITQRQWEAVTGYNNSYFPGENRPVEWVQWQNVRDDFLPAINAAPDTSWTDSLAFGSEAYFYLVTAVGDSGSGEPWRLPSESEWEYSCRSGTDTRFHWGDDLTYAQVADYAWYNANGGDETHDVGLKLPNLWGLYDITGNVYEWCEDYYHPDYIGAPVNGNPWLDPPSTDYVCRGGSWNSGPQRCRSSDRNQHDGIYRSSRLGFRLVRNAE